MISFGLVCAKGHEFEAWFKDSATFERQAKRGLVTCAQCGSAKVSKALMAPRLAGTKKSRRGRVAAEAAPPQQALAGGAPDPKAAELMRELRELRRKVEENAEYVGDRFAEEARKIHYEEAPSRGIYGEATPAEAQELSEEGIGVMPLPPLPEDAN